jgi:subtilisin family serine protease
VNLWLFAAILTLTGYIPDRAVVGFCPGVPAHVQDRLIPDAVRVIPGINARVVVADKSIERWRHHPLVEYVELDVAVEAVIVPDDPLYGDALRPQWHLPKIGCESAWETTTGDPEIVIAILDTGVYGDHEDLVSKMVPGWNVVDDNVDTEDVNGHGTIVAGQAAAATDNGIGIASVAWDCGIMPVRVAYANGWASGSSIAEGLVWAADNGARVANVSFESWCSGRVTAAGSTHAPTTRT